MPYRKPGKEMNKTLFVDLTEDELIQIINKTIPLLFDGFVVPHDFEHMSLIDQNGASTNLKGCSLRIKLCAENLKSDEIK